MNKTIISRDNPTYRRLLSLLESSGIRKHGEFLLSGRKLVPEFLRSSQLHFKALITAEGMGEVTASRAIPRLELPQTLFKDLDQHGTQQPLLWGVTPELTMADLAAPPRGFELVLALANPLNLGAALRSAEAFAVDKVILLTECANPFLGKVLRSSSGSALRLNLARGPSVKSLGASDDVNFWALDMKGQEISKFRFSPHFRLLIGEEGLGVPTDFAPDRRLSIAIKTGMDSLNAVAAASIALYAFRNQHPILI